MKRTDKFQSTVTLYNQLGKKYIQDTEKVTPDGRDSFIKILPKKAVVLDVGCAGGRDTKVFLKMDVRKLDFKPQSFDGIWAQAVLLHIERKDFPKVLKECYKILRPYGYVHIAVKRGKGLQVIKEKMFGGFERTFTFYMKGELETVFKKQGFKIVSSKIIDDEFGRKGLQWVNILAQK